MKKFSFLAALVLPLFIATAASAGPISSSPTLDGYVIGIGLSGPNQVLAVGFSSKTIYSVNFNTYAPTVITDGTITSLQGPEIFVPVPGTSNQYFVSNELGSAISVVSVSNGVATPVTSFGNQNFVSGLAVLNGILYAESQAGGLDEYSLVNGSWTLLKSITTPSTSFGGMSVTATGNIVIGTSAGLQILSPTGTLLSSFGQSIGQVAGVAVDGAGNIFASSPNTGTVYKYSQNGTLITTFQVPVGSSAWQIAIDAYGNMFVSTWGTGTVVKFGNAGAAFIQNTTPDAPTNLAAATVGHTTMKLTWNYQTSPTTQFICTASNGATATVTGTSCSLNGFDLYNPGSYSFSVIAVVDGVQSDAAVLSVNVK